MNTTINNSSVRLQLAGRKGLRPLPLFSCVIPVKGARSYFTEAIASLKDQGMGEELEIIIQDGDLESDSGQSDALNRGFAKARGKWLFWLNADDVLLPGALKAVAEVIKAKPNAQWIAGNTAYLNPEGRVRWCVWDSGWRCAYWGLPVQVYGPSAFFRREVWTQMGGFDENLHYAMDVDLWCRMRKAGLWYVKVPRLIWGFRLHEGSKTCAAQEHKVSVPVSREMKEICARYGIKYRVLAYFWAHLVRFVNGDYLRAAWLSLRLKIKGCETKI